MFVNRRCAALVALVAASWSGGRLALADEPPAASAAPAAPADSAALVPAELPAPPPAGVTPPPKAPAAAEVPPPEFPIDAFLPTADDPRIPNFLRALRLGKDSLLIGAYLQPGFRYVTDTAFNADDSDGFFFVNARLTGRGDVIIHEKFGASARFDFDVNQGNFAVRDVYGTVYWDEDLIALDIGQMKVPFGLSEIQAESKLQFPLPADTRKLTFGRDLGVRLRSDFPIGPVGVHLSAMMANGEGGFRQRVNLDNEFLYAGRIEIAPMGRMQMSEPDLEESAPQLTVGFSAGHNAALGNELGLADVGAGETRIEGDLRFWWRGLSIRGEYLHGLRDATADTAEYERYGASAQVGYVLPIPIAFPKFEVVARYQQLDVNKSLDGTEEDEYVVDNTEVRQLQFGANVYLAKHAVKLMFLYQLTDLVEGPKTDDNGDVLLGDTIYVVTQFGWL